MKKLCFLKDVGRKFRYVSAMYRYRYRPKYPQATIGHSLACACVLAAVRGGMSFTPDRDRTEK